MKDRAKYIQSYGRRRTRGLSDKQKHNLTELYGLYGISITEQLNILKELQTDDIIIEIGFGRAEHLINNAMLKPSIGFIGCDPFENGVANALSLIHNNQLQNVKIFNGDARLLLDALQDKIIRRFYVLFPDPWTKARHHKRRILSVDFLLTLQKKLKHHGDIVIATDCKDYMISIIENLKKLEGLSYSDDFSELIKKPSCFLDTKYQQKALSQNKDCYYLRVY